MLIGQGEGPVGTHTVYWDDGLKVTRVFKWKNQITLCITWQGVKREVRLGKRVSEIRRVMG